MTDAKVPAAPILRFALTILSVAWLTSCASVSGPNAIGEVAPVLSPEAHELNQGKRRFKMSCSGCHGTYARGNGPDSRLLDVPVPDLTLLASRRGGSFPSDEVYQIIDGQVDLGAHGARHMPVWGYEFFGEDPDDEAAHREATEKIESLVHFLNSIQRPR